MSSFEMPQKFREIATSFDDSSGLPMQFDNFFRESQMYLFIEHLCPILVIYLGYVVFCQCLD